MSIPWKDEYMVIFLKINIWNNKFENYHKTNIRKTKHKSVYKELNLIT